MILIIQNGYITPNIGKYLNESYLIIKSFEFDTFEFDHNQYSIIIVLGGFQSVTTISEYPYLQQVIKLILKCIENKKPLIGICLGCHLIAYALGCNIKSSGKINIGYDAQVLKHSNIFRCHIDYIDPCDKIEVLEYYENMPYLYKYQDFCYGIQCHPDITPECVQKYSNHQSSNQYAIENRESINLNNKAILDFLITTVQKT